LRRTTRLLIIAGMVVALGASLPAGASAAHATPFGENLLVNPGAEDGSGTIGYTTVPIPGWAPVNQATVVRYGSAGFPTRAESDRIHGGRKFFSCGKSGGGVINQTVRIRGRNTSIDTGHMQLRVKGRIATYDSQTDAGRIQVIPLKGTQDTIDQLSTPTVSASGGIFKTVSLTVTAPPLTRYVLIRLYGQTVEGDYCDAYFDKVSLVIEHT
jgi:hypothetical protein